MWGGVELRKCLGAGTAETGMVLPGNLTVMATRVAYRVAAVCSVGGGGIGFHWLSRNEGVLDGLRQRSSFPLLGGGGWCVGEWLASGGSPTAVDVRW